MNERFDSKYTTDTSAWIISHANGKNVGFHCGAGITIHGADFDREGLDALRDAINCYLDTGSFAALSDESGVPYQNKRMRWSENNCIIEILRVGPPVIVKYEDSGQPWTLCNEHQLRPLAPPAPKIRPYTPVEAAAHLGRKMNWGGHSRYKAVSVDEKGIRFESNSGWMHCNYDGLAGDNYKWDDGSPCGVIEEPKP